MDPAKTPAELKNCPAELTAEHLVVHGIVQGVGMRPFVVGLADRIGVTGTVRNVGAHLVIDAIGTRCQLDAFQAGLRKDAPAASRIVRLTVTPGEQPDLGVRGFAIDESQPAPAWS